MHTFLPRFFIVCLSFFCTLTLFYSAVQAAPFNFIDLKDYKVIAIEGLNATKGGDNEISFAKGQGTVLTFTSGKAVKKEFAENFLKEKDTHLIFNSKEVRFDNDTSFTAFTVENTSNGLRSLTLFAANGQFFTVTTYTCVPQLPFMLYAINSKNTSLINIFRTIAQQKTQSDGENWETWLSSSRKELPKFEGNVSKLDLTISLTENLRMQQSKTWQVKEEKNFCVITPQKGSQESDLWVAIVPYSTPQDAGFNEHFYDTMRALLHAAGIANTTRGRYYGGEYSFYTSTGGMGSASLIGNHALITVEHNLGCSSQMADYFRTFLYKNYEAAYAAKMR